ncbi:hypothetical protein VN97_g10828 [Penicillium thymicola]|uniref:Uncharacterized protein n=1 Tax=Penicillium thymicola TaxID=293382 RepID=A0AAI9T882_PENTH|nr:hypothetical protein VN97_g10828 [Penicillium thymicola]
MIPTSAAFIPNLSKSGFSSFVLYLSSFFELRGGCGFKDWLADYLHLFIIDSIPPKSFSWGFFVLVLLVSRFPLILC